MAAVAERLSELPDQDFARWVTLTYQLGRKPDLLAAPDHIVDVGKNQRDLVLNTYSRSCHVVLGRIL